MADLKSQLEKAGFTSEDGSKFVNGEKSVQFSNKKGTSEIIFKDGSEESFRTTDSTVDPDLLKQYFGSSAESKSAAESASPVNQDETASRAASKAASKK